MSVETDFLGNLFAELKERVDGKKVGGNRSVYIFYSPGSDTVYIRLTKKECVTKLSVVLRDDGRVLYINTFDDVMGAVVRELDLSLPESEPVEFVVGLLSE